jgi:hypothetical protein
MTFYVTLNEVKGLLCAISEKLVLVKWNLHVRAKHSLSISMNNENFYQRMLRPYVTLAITFLLLAISNIEE